MKILLLLVLLHYIAKYTVSQKRHATLVWGIILASVG